MTIIADKDRETIRELLDRDLADEVELLLLTRPRSPIYVPGREECQTCDETRELLEELVGLSDKLSLQIHDLSARPEAATAFSVQDVPAILVRRRAATAAKTRRGEAVAQESSPPESSGVNASPLPPNVRFLGLPAGYEFSTLLADIVDVSKGQTDLADETRDAVRAIDQPVHIQVFVTPT